MEKITDEQLREILNAHALYLQGDPDGRRADFSYKDLRERELRGADLRGANFTGAWLQEAYFTWADLRGANFRGANMEYADVHGADLRGANLWGTILPRQYITFTPHGRNDSQITYSFSEDKVWYGFFYGTLAEFELKWQSHPTPWRRQQYLIMIDAIKKLKELYDNQ